MIKLKNKSKKLKRSFKIKRRMRGGDCNGFVGNDPTFWPINSGCVGNNNVLSTLEVGTIIDRFGDTTGRTFSPVRVGVPYSYEARAIPFIKMGDFRSQSNCLEAYRNYAQLNYHQYRVKKPFSVFVCKVKYHRFNNDPEQDYEGGGVQYTLMVNSVTNAEKSSRHNFPDTHVPTIDDMLIFEYLEEVAPITIPRFRNNAVFDRSLISPLKSGVTKTPLISKFNPLSNFMNRNNNANIDDDDEFAGGNRRRSIKRRRN